MCSWTNLVNVPAGFADGADDTIGGGGVWGTITGVLATQADLQAALDAKASTSDLNAASNVLRTATGNSTNDLNTSLRSVLAQTNITSANVTTALGFTPQATDADLDDLADGSLTGSKVGTGIDAGNITSGTVAHARLGTGGGGATKFLREDSTYQTIAAGGVTKVTLATSVTNSTTTAAKITSLDTTLGAGTYVFRYFVRYQSSVTTTGVKFSVNHSGTVTAFNCVMRYGSTGGAAATAAATQVGNTATGNIHESFTRRAISTAANMGPTVSVDAANSDMLMILEGLVTVSVSGNLQLYHASETANGTYVMAGTTLLIE